MIEKVVTDSFDGRILNEDFSENLLEGRTFAKNDKSAKQFYELWQGEDWGKVVELDTEAL